MISWGVKFEMICANGLLMNYLIASPQHSYEAPIISLWGVSRSQQGHPGKQNRTGFVSVEEGSQKQQGTRMAHRESSPSLQESVRENRQAEYSVSQKHFLKGGTWRSNCSLPAEHRADATGIIFQHSIDIYQTAFLNQALADKLGKETRSLLPLSKRQWAWLWLQCWRTSVGLVRSSQVG